MICSVNWPPQLTEQIFSSFEIVSISQRALVLPFTLQNRGLSPTLYQGGGATCRLVSDAKLLQLQNTLSFIVICCHLLSNNLA